MRVAIDARVVDGEPGGIQQAILGLAYGLSSLGGEEEYLFLVYDDHAWLQPALRGGCRALVVGRSPALLSRRGARSRASVLAAKAARYFSEGQGRVLPPSPIALSQPGVSVVHFMRQRGFATSLPNIYQPHDLQHVHRPEFFDPFTRMYRRRLYTAMARQSTLVGVMTSNALTDVSLHLGVPRDAVIVVPWASVLGFYEHPTIPVPGLPDHYLLYPAQSWPHKNHLALVDAVAQLRDVEGLEVNVVLTGAQTAHWPAIARRICQCRLEEQIIPLGYVAPQILRRLYADARGVVFPSLYEGWGLPVVEAFEAGVPVACSAITPLRDLAAGAALLFDPQWVGSIAMAVARLWTDDLLRIRLVNNGRIRSNSFSWERTARLLRAHYRCLAEQSTQEDRQLLQAPSVV